MAVPRQGGCACGSVRYRLTSDPLFTHCCHCLNCQRQTGSAFVVNVLIEADRMELHVFLTQGRGGTIVSVGSITAQAANPTQAAYGAAKAWRASPGRSPPSTVVRASA